MTLFSNNVIWFIMVQWVPCQGQKGVPSESQNTAFNIELFSHLSVILITLVGVCKYLF